MSKLIKIKIESPQVYTVLPVDEIKKIEAVTDPETAINVHMKDYEIHSLTDLSDIVTINNYIKANLFKPAAAKKLRLQIRANKLQDHCKVIAEKLLNNF